MLLSQGPRRSSQAKKFQKYLLMIIVPTAFALILVILLALPPNIAFMYATPTKYQQISTFPIANGQNIHVSNFTFNSSDGKINEFQTNQINVDNQKKNVKDKLSAQALQNEMKIIYYHKNNQIAIVYDIKTKKIKFSAPADTGYKLLFPNGLKNEEMAALSSIVLYLPSYLIQQFQKVTGSQIKFTTDLSYDGVYNSTTNKYKLVSEEYLQFSFKKIEESEKDLADYVPVINNISDPKEVARELAKCYSRIVQNFLQLIENHQTSIQQLQKRSGRQSFSLINQSPSLSQKILSCIRIQHDLLRCQAEVWRSGQLPTENIGKCRPLEIWSYVLYSV